MMVGRNDAQERSGKAKDCSGKGSIHDSEEMSAGQANYGFENEYSPGSSSKERNHAENVYMGQCSSDENKEALLDTCEDACCFDNEKPLKRSCKDACCPNEDEAEAEDEYQDSCCSKDKENAVPEKGQETYCSDDSKNFKKRYHDDCCSGSVDKVNKRGNVSACCERKSAPCCNVSCIDRIAMRECESGCGKKALDHGSQAEGIACTVHRKRIHEKYGAKLAALGCICRTLIALGQESCCITKEQAPARKRRSVRRPSGSSSTSSDTHNIEPKVQSSTCARGCCELAKASPSKLKGRAVGKATGRATEIDPGGDESVNAMYTQTGSTDIEKGTLGTHHIVLSITGMTCTACETKLQKVLGTLPPITNLKTSLVLSRVEFSLDAASMSPESVMKHLERTTEFKCEQILTRGSNLDIVLGNVKEFLDQPPPLGVNNMQLLGKSTVRINFDPKVIGARSLIKENSEYACQLAPPPADLGLAAGSKHVRNMGFMTLLSIVLTVPVLILAWAPLEDRPITYGAVSLIFATVIQLIVAGPFYLKAFKSFIFSRMIEMDLLIVLSTSAAYIFSVVSFGYLVSGKPLSAGEFFETSTLLVTLIMIGRWIAALSRQKAVESMSIRSLQSSNAQLVTLEGIEIEEIDTRLLEYGDIFSVAPEQRVPTDGCVLSGCSEIDESMLTGESKLIRKDVGSKVIAGSINASGKLTVRLTHLPEENTVSVIAGMVDNAKLSKPKIQELTDRVTTYFVPLIMSLTIITFVVWISVGITVLKQSGSDAAIQAIIYAITVLIVSCPCAIGLAVPMVIVIGSGVAAERGVIFRSADSIEMAYKATHVVFDKTGTLTAGELKIVGEQFFAEDTIIGRSVVLGLVKNSKHPVSAAITANFAAHGINAAKVDEIKTVAGKGIEGKVDGKIIRGGNAHWLEVESDPRVQCILVHGHTLFCVTLDSKLFAVFGLADTIRPEATATVSKLKQMGVRVSLLSGDDFGAVQIIAKEIGLNPDESRSRCSPGDKQNYIQELSASSVGKRKATVVFVGDGTNDAVALAQATVGVHMGSGTDVAQSAADVVLMRPSLEGVLTMINISRAAVLRIKFNFGWSFIYNILALLFASGALSSARKGTAIKIPPEYAGLGELVSVLPVVAIAVGLKWAKL